MSGQIIGLTSSQRQSAAPVSFYETLYNYLISTLGQDFVINGYGESLGPSEYRPWTLTGTGSVTEYVQSGGIFIDWTSWPMSYEIDANGFQNNIGPSGFQTFAKDIGYDWLGAETFGASEADAPGGILYPFGAGFNEKGSLNGIYLPSGSFTYNSAQWSLNGGGYAAMIGLHHPGIGWYFYGVYHDPLTEKLFGAFGTPRWVPSAVYGSFIEACVHGQSTGNGFSILHEAYTVPATQPQKSEPEPSSPYGGQTSDSPGPSSSGNGDSVKVTTTTTQPSSGSGVPATPSTSTSGLPSWAVPAAGVTLIAGGLGFAAYIGAKSGWFTK